MEPFASIDDYITRYGSVDDEGILLACLEDATDMMCAEMDANDVEYTDPSESFTSRLMRVCRTVAHRAMGDGDDSGIPFGATQVSQTAGSFSASALMSNPYGDLFLTDAERRSLGIGGQLASVHSPYS